MSLFGKWNPAWVAAMLLMAGAGCSPMDQGPMDEEKEPHYVLGKSRVNAMDYSGAIRAFEESLEANPHSAQAHYQLAMLYDNQESDPAAAIYHYQQYLKYDPKAENADAVSGRIATCKQQLAADVLQLPSAPAAQQQLEKLAEENRRLHDQLNQWQAYFTAQQAIAKTNAALAQAARAAQPETTSPTPDDITAQPAGSGWNTAGSANAGTATTTPSTTRRNPSPSKTGKLHTHIVTSGETLASIARRSGVSVAALEAANPGVNPRKLKAGQLLNLPSP